MMIYKKRSKSEVISFLLTVPIVAKYVSYPRLHKTGPEVGITEECQFRFSKKLMLRNFSRADEVAGYCNY